MLSLNEGLRVSLAIHNIVMAVDRITLSKIEPYLEEIEDIVASDTAKPNLQKEA